MDEFHSFSVVTKGHTNPTGKPRVYFTCHPLDFKRSFDKICQDVFSVQDCAIYYDADTSRVPSENYREDDLERINLFIMPVSTSLLTDRSIALDVDFPFAKKKHIPVLPILLEPVDNRLYNEVFGSIQYLAPGSKDSTEIPYIEKLRKYLKSVLISDEDAKRARDAFDAYIFLSYRKKDRHLANDLLRMIHRKQELRSVAVWYDEFLTPGESFDDNIKKMLQDSALFTMLVTKSLLEENNGNPNYVMAQEYPAAKESGIVILPVEIDSGDECDALLQLDQSDREMLATKFSGIPHSIHLHEEDEEFLDRLQNTIYQNAIRKSDDPIHNYLIGLAYLDGIDVEVNREYALELLESADASGVVEASKKLSQMYLIGQGVEYDIFRAAEYEIKVLDFYRQAEPTVENKRRLIQEIVDMADICLSGKTDRFEPSSGKLLCVSEGLRLYREAAQLQESSVVNSGYNEAEIILLRDYLSKVCRILSSGGRKIWSDCSQTDVVSLCRKYVHYSEMVANHSEQFDDLDVYRESLRMLLNEMKPKDKSYNATFEKALEIAHKACEHKATVPGDYYQLLDLIYNHGIRRFATYCQYGNALIWIHEFYVVIGELKQIISKKPKERNSELYQKIFDIEINIVGKDLVNMIYNLTINTKHPKPDIASKILNEVSMYSEDYDVFVREYLLPGAQEMIQSVMA